MRRKRDRGAFQRSPINNNSSSSTSNLRPGASSRKEQEHFITRFGRACNGAVDIRVIERPDFGMVTLQALAGDPTAGAILQGITNFKMLMSTPEAPTCLDCDHEFGEGNMPEAITFVLPFANRKMVMAIGICRDCMSKPLEQVILKRMRELDPSMTILDKVARA
jgi:hypothetical protein